MVKSSLRNLYLELCGQCAYKSRAACSDDRLQFLISAHGVWWASRLFTICGLLLYAIVSMWATTNDSVVASDVVAVVVAAVAFLVTLATSVSIALNRGGLGSVHKTVQPSPKSIPAESVQAVELRVRSRPSRRAGTIYLILHYDQRGQEATRVLYADDDSREGHKRAFQNAEAILEWLQTDAQLIVDQEKMRI